ncbi:hypothetical protein C8J57DRAFT_1307259 [Mycena rebaudengoi]|nr:hypothetical protein C8J57DRAFT_1307259 [Mycena rebaudengoi]
MTCSSLMTIREFPHVRSMYSGAAHTFLDLSLDPHSVEELSFHNPSVILQHLCLEEVVTYLNCLGIHFTEFNDTAALYIAATASYPLARQFIPAESPSHFIVFTARPANLSALSLTVKVRQKTMTLCSITPCLHTSIPRAIGTGGSQLRHRSNCAHRHIVLLHLCIPPSIWTMERFHWYQSLVSNDRCTAMHTGSGCHQVKAYGLSHVSDLWGPTTAGLRRYSACSRQLRCCCAAVLCPLVTETVANCVRRSMRCNSCCSGMTALVLSVFLHAPFGGSSCTFVFGFVSFSFIVSRSLQRWECQYMAVHIIPSTLLSLDIFDT